jgi:hypothetical protein
VVEALGEKSHEQKQNGDDRQLRCDVDGVVGPYVSENLVQWSLHIDLAAPYLGHKKA